MSGLNLSPQLVSGQLLIGLINGSTYALLSLGLAVIYGLLRVVNFAHGTFYMLGALCAYWLGSTMGLGFWTCLIVAPVAVAALALCVERLLLRRLYGLDQLYGLLLTFGVAIVIEGGLRYFFGASGRPYAPPAELAGIWNLGFAIVPKYRAFVVVASIAVCVLVWLLLERTRLGNCLRAATENPGLVQALGIDVPFLLALGYMLGAALAAFGGVLAAPIYQVSPLMGTNLIIIVFAVVVAGGVGSIAGSVVMGYVLGLAEGVTKLFYPQGASVVVFIVMALILFVRPSGLFGRGA